MNYLVEVKKIKKNYSSKEAVKGISFNIKENEILGLLGPNGSGKTTTIGMMLGLVTPSNGEILIENKNLNSFRRDEILKRFNFASPYVELPKKLTVKQNLEVYGRLYGIKDLEIHINKKEKVFWKKEYDNFVINHGGDTIKLGETEIRSLHTPGHTPGSTCYHIGDDLIAGDTLFVFGCGRCDLHGGSPEEMFNTLKDIKISLDPKTIILPGHNYSIKRESTLQEEIQGNPFMKFNNINKIIPSKKASYN